MKIASLAAVALATAAAVDTHATGDAPQYTRIPFGREVLSHCLHEVDSGSHSYAQPDGSITVVSPDGSTRVIPRCESQHPTFRFHGASNVEDRPLPANYDGWLTYTSLNVSDVGKTGGFDAFTSTMSVPDQPKKQPELLYLFPGLQNVDWIPKVTKQPPKDPGFDIIQPVLQYPASGFGNGRGWELKSWYVTLNNGALQTRGEKVSPGQEILCNMTRTGPESWSVSGAIKGGNQKAQVQAATAARLQVQPWAYSAVTECYGCKSCATFPTKPLTFTDNKLYQNGVLVDVKGSDWHIDAKPPAKRFCNEKTTVASNGDATTTFQ